MITKLSRYGYLIAVWLFVAGILVQVFLVGLSLLGRQPIWPTHVALGHGLSLFALLMLVFVYSGRMPQPMKSLTWLNFGIYFLLADVVILLRETAPLVAALHPVLAVVLFASAVSLAIRARRVLREDTGTAIPAVGRDTPAVPA